MKPGSDAALANGLLHVLIRDRLIDEAYIRDRTEGFEEARRIAAAYWPERVEQITGVAEADAGCGRAASRPGASAPWCSRRAGPEQQAQGVNNTLAYLNLALALGKVGAPLSGFGSLTGQGNGQGGREHGQKADQLPGYRRIDDPAARAHVAGVWGVAPADLPGRASPRTSCSTSIGAPAASARCSSWARTSSSRRRTRYAIERRLKALDFLVVADFFLSETAQLADVVLPSAQWAEEDGTMTNLEGRVILRRRAFDPPDGVRTDVDVLCALASRFDAGHAVLLRQQPGRSSTSSGAPAPAVWPTTPA